MKCIKSYYYSDQEILLAIAKLYLSGEWFELDPAFSTGGIYKGLEKPKYKFDIKPQVDGVKKADVRKLPIENESIKSILFDPPFLFGIKNKNVPHNNNNAAKRYGIFNKFCDLENVYNRALMEFYRILEYGGYLIFKCQDFTDSNTTLTHCFVYNFARQKGFESIDLFIRLVRNRIYNSALTQRHSRKFHSYYFVFQKKRLAKRWGG